MLESFLVSQVFAFFLIFCRIGSGILVMPAFGETYVPPQLRLALAFMLSLLLVPLLGHAIPPLPSSPLALALLVASEILTGLFIGTICSILISATHVAGMIFSFQSGMSSAVVFDVTQSSQGSLIGNFMGLLALVLLFASDMHHLMLHGLTDSYAVFAPGHWPPLHDFVETATRTVADTFLIAAQVSTPAHRRGNPAFPRRRHSLAPDAHYAGVLCHHSATDTDLLFYTHHHLQRHYVMVHGILS